METKQYSPIVVAIALSLYEYNVVPFERAKKLHDHFEGDCMEIQELLVILATRIGHEATELPYPTAKVYVAHALEAYGEEAEKRARVNSILNYLFRDD